MTKPRRSLIFVIFLCFLNLLWSCSKDTETISSTAAENDLLQRKLPTEQQVLRFNLNGNVSSFDPVFTRTTNEFNICIQLFEGLMTYNPRSLKPQPGIAKKWTVSEDGLTYTFSLKENVFWSDGTPITAQTFYDSWMRALNKETGAYYAYMMHVIKNGRLYTDGQVPASEVGIKVIDNYTLSVTLESPISYFLEIVVLPIFMPVPTHIVNQFGKNWILPQNIATNGPFALRAFEEDKKILMEKNINYHDAQNVHLQSIEISLINDPYLHYEKYRVGELNWLYGIPKSMIEDVALEDQTHFHRYGGLGTEHYLLNVKVSALSNHKVRQALMLSIVRSNLLDIIKAGVPSISFVPRNMPNYRGVVLRENPERARQLLAEAGYPNGENFPVLKLLVQDNVERRKTADKIVEMWKNELNINVIVDEVERSEYNRRIFAMEFDIARTSWVGDYIDPSTFLETLMENSAYNQTGWKSNVYDSLLIQARSEQDPDKRNSLFIKAEEILLDEAPIISLYNYVHMFMLDPTHVVGIHGNVMNIHPLKEVFLIE